VPLLPFLGKAFHIDDYSYLRAARHISGVQPFASPAIHVDMPDEPDSALPRWLRPYDFPINWRGNYEPAWRMMNKPPLIPYYLALGVKLFGEHERPLHAMFLIFPLVAGVALYSIARRTVRHPLWPTLAFLACPAALVGSTSLMVDNPSFALYLSAVAVFLSAAERRSGARFCVAGVLAGLAVWANYVCLSLLPLLTVYLIVKRRRLTASLAYLLIPAGMFALWCVQGWLAHGTPDILAALGHRADSGEMLYFLPALIATLTFIGGCAPSLLVLCLFITRGKGHAAAAGGCAAGVALLLAVASYHLTPSHHPVPPLGIVLGAVFAFASASALYATGRYARSGWSAECLLLLLWIAGIAAFLLFYNWTVAARFVLFLVPPVLLIAHRCLEDWVRRSGVQRAVAIAGVALSLALSMALARADTRWANAQRRAARDISTELRLQAPPRNIWFTCHWGLQYYFERMRLVACDMRWFTDGTVQPGTFVIVASVSTGRDIPPALKCGSTTGRGERRLCAELEGPPRQYKAGLTFQLNNPLCGAGFYTHKYGPLPYTASSVPQEFYAIYRFTVR